MRKFTLLFLSTLFLVEASCGVLDHVKPVLNKTRISSIKYVDYIYLINLDHRTEKLRETLEELRPYGIVPYRFSAVNGWGLPLETIHDIGFKLEKGMRQGTMGTRYLALDGNEIHSHELVETIGNHYFVHCMSRGAVGCLMSHISILKDAYDSGYEIIWVMEDDIEVKIDPRILSKYIYELDSRVGRKGWDLLFTFYEYRDNNGNYLTAYGACHRPNVDTRDQQKYNINKKISRNLRQVGSRFGTQSMIWTRRGIKKALDYFEKHKLYLPIDMDIPIIPGIRIFSTTHDIVTNKLNVQSDLGSSPLNKKK
ncbi:MAG: glycosyltransferase family 25 protein [Simkaniaceae bacterium]|nr:glycosyltransferase family 25 protein [Simkaniaceae bacterium]